MYKKLLGLSALGLVVASTQVQADEIVFAIGGTPQSLQGQTAQEFTRRLQERLGDEHQVELYDSGQLGNEQQLVQKLRLGTVDLAAISSIMSSIDSRFALFDMPFLVKDRDHLKRLDQEIIMKDLAEGIGDKGLRIVSTWENGFRHITNNERPIETPEDLNGLKLRTPQSEWRTRMFETWGANPTPMAFSEVFVALQTGVVDGQENPLSNINGAKFQEVQDYLSLSNHVYSPIWLTAGKGNWEKLPEDVRTAITEVGAETQGWALARGAELDENLVGTMREAGMEINRVDRDAFVEASAPVYQAYAERVDGGQELIDRAMTLAEE
ncbi:TRAP transporter substrate-binding protein [Halomonas elongata]|uniref:TRAP transporter substrate-binding protein n=1 Tax=Halomonas elongata (strain ATCC 33173 / DSM 2581 / NBRC 15536 / NCIMB 2198 / 1H9) TaxID=768066 RepID=E1V481_HALED|nr:TRAP transporter substrate-binding protein [Halomonas elongata]WBF18160.1 TRAP transporter substrate-binding protein [Halomonas elongata]WPU47011.1 TRAP transporter substrate-binding protein [Halomonas elongata DSM 2581]CBV40918.1 TRAP transporter substrate-binding protein [Halomonas elongata DSM 2581]